MGLFDFFRKQEPIVESIDAFKGKDETGRLTDKQLAARSGEGIDDMFAFQQAFGATQISPFNSFYNRHIQQVFANEQERIREYRKMSEYPEIADVIEDAVNESTQEDHEGKILKLQIKDDKLNENKNIVKNLFSEFEELFYNRINIETKLWDFMKTFYVDGRVYIERIIDVNNKKNGIINLKKLPSETMDHIYDIMTGQTHAFYQYLGKRSTRPVTIEEAEKDRRIIVFYPEQISYLDYGVYGQTKGIILGYLEKARVPYNQLKLLETSVIIYRIIRAPERLVFRIDTGSMPVDKANRFVEKIKQKMEKKQTFDPTTGRLTQEPNVMSLLENYYLPQSADGRGSNIESVGGNSKGFEELDDVQYFARKLYRALKYPLSRVQAAQERRSGDVVFGGQSVGEIARDEIKWAKFLENQQRKFSKELLDIFLLHLSFKGLKKQYNLKRDMLHIEMTPPSHYHEQMEQNFLETRMNNYQNFANNEEFSKSFLMKEFLGLTDEQIEENWKGFEEDEDYRKKYKKQEEGSKW